jgi:hypothetical protein
MKDKISGAEVSQMMKMASSTLRTQAETIKTQEGTINTLSEKVAHYQKRERVEKIASMMEEKGLEPHSDMTEKVASLMQKDNLDVIEAAVGMTAPQTKMASVADDGRVVVEGSSDSEAANLFTAGLASLE